MTPNTNIDLPSARGVSGLTDADLRRASEALNCEEACIEAVIAVESSGSGFLPSGRPKILFEAHRFSDLTDGDYDDSYPNISSSE